LELAALIERFPALERSLLAWRSLVGRQTVWFAPSDQQLVLAWRQGSTWRQRQAPLPADICRDGLPLQRDALADFIADLLLDSGLPPRVVDLVLILPLEACHWRLLRPPGAGLFTRVADLRSLQPDLGWSLPLADVTLALESQDWSAAAATQDAAEQLQLLVGTERLLLQAWVSVIEAADLQLLRVDGLLAAARRGLLTRRQAQGETCAGDLAWLIQQGSGWRLLLLRDGWPELERSFAGDALPSAVQEVLEAWACHAGGAEAPRGSWITAAADAWDVGREALAGWSAENAGGQGLDTLVSLVLPDAGPDAEAPPAGLDLLDERRDELGLASEDADITPPRALMLQGGIWAGGVVALAVLVLGLMAWREAQQAQQLELLLPVEQRVTRAETRLGRMRAATAALRKNNTRLAEQLVAVRSGSALLEQLRRLTPAGVQLQMLRVKANTIELSGEAQALGDPGALERINALVLALSALPMSAAEGVKVVKIIRAGEAQGPLTAVSFSLTWELDPEARPSLAALKALGADGLAERYRLLQRAGVAL
jgi:type IV pilus assembly protein PilN